MVDRIYIVRHGFRINWITSDWTSPTNLPRDPPLASYGFVQADELARYFLSLPEDERPTAIFSSPYYRCLQTSKPTAQALGIPIYVEHGLSEWYMPVQPGTGLFPRPPEAHVLQTHVPEVDTAWKSIYYPSRKGESIEAIHDRSEELMKALVPHVERTFQGQHQRILLISHAATIIAMARSLVGDKSIPVRPGCCSLNHFKRKKDADGVIGAWDPVILAYHDHLSEGKTRDWSFEDLEVTGTEVMDIVGMPGTEHEKDEPVGCQIEV